MDNGVFQIILEYLSIVFMLFAGILFTLFIAMGILSTKNLLNYQRKNSFVDLSKIMASPLAPSITIIAPAYNEGRYLAEDD